MKYRLLGIIMVLLLLLGCGTLLSPNAQPGKYSYTHKVVYTGTPKREIPVWIDKNFSLSDRASIEDAINSWNFALNGYVKITVVDLKFDMEVDKIVQQVRSNGWLFLKINSHNTIVPENDKGYQTIGFTDDIGGHHMYLVRDRLSDWHIYGVTLHEMGHLLGSGHVGTRLMSPHYSGTAYQCVDWVTIVEVAKAQGLDVNKLNFCFDNGDDSGNVRTEGGVTFTL